MTHSKKKHRRILIIILVLLVAASTIFWYRSCKSRTDAITTENTIRCSTPAPSVALRQAINQRLQKKREEIPKLREPGSVTIPVHFHIITTPNGEGDVPDAVVTRQIAVLNSAFSGTGPGGSGANTPFRFSLAGIDRTQNESWFNMPFGSTPSAQETAAMNTLKRGDKSTLNIYTARLATGALGWARVPWDPASGVDPANPLDGVVVRHSTLPGGGTFSFNEGDTATHEVGHWLGLLHIFEGGCTDPGDDVADTAFQAGPASPWGCPSSNTCPQLGADPIENFMNTTKDSCMFQFTAGQSERMDLHHLVFRT